MRTAIVVALALLPTLLHAQTPASATLAANFEARLTIPAEPGQPAVSDFDSVPSTPVRVSTGVIAPEIVSTVEVQADNDEMWRATGLDKTVVVSLVVDKTGKPTNLKVTKSAGDELDENVLASVAKYRFKPGRLNNEPTSVEVNLEVIIHAPTRY